MYRRLEGRFLQDLTFITTANRLIITPKKVLLLSLNYNAIILLSAALDNIGQGARLPDIRVPHINTSFGYFVIITTAIFIKILNWGYRIKIIAISAQFW